MTPVPKVTSKQPKNRKQPYTPGNVNSSSQGGNGMPPKRTPCQLCHELILDTMKTIKNHKKRIHIKSRKWECYCGLRFGVKYELKRHRKNFKCEKVDLPPRTAADELIIAHHENVDKCKTREDLNRVLFLGDPRDILNIRYDYKQNINRLGLPDEPQEYGGAGAMPPLGGINVGYSGMSALGSMGLYNSPTTTTQSSPDSEEMPSTPESTRLDDEYWNKFQAGDYDHEPYDHRDPFWEEFLGPLRHTKELGCH